MPPSRHVKEQSHKTWKTGKKVAGLMGPYQEKAAFSAWMAPMFRRYSWGYLGLASRRTTPPSTSLVTPPAPRESTVWSSSIIQIL